MDKVELTCIRQMLAGTAALLVCLLAFLVGMFLMGSLLVSFLAAIGGFAAAAYTIHLHLYFGENPEEADGGPEEK